MGTFKESFKQLDPGPDIEQLRQRLSTLERSGGSGDGSTGAAFGSIRTVPDKYGTIQAAHDDLPETGGTVFVVGKPGSGGATLTKPTAIYGFGTPVARNTTSKSWDLNGGSLTIRSEGCGVHDLSLENGGLVIDGDEWRNSNALDCLLFDNVVINDAPGVGVEITHPVYDSIFDIGVHDAEGWGWDIHPDWFNENIFFRMGAHSCPNGIRFRDSTELNGNVIINLYSEKNDNIGLLVDGSLRESMGNHITGYGVENCSIDIQESNGDGNTCNIRKSEQGEVSVALRMFESFVTEDYSYASGTGVIAHEDHWDLGLQDYVDFADDNGASRLFLPDGSYRGRVNTPAGLNIVGESRDGVTISNGSDHVIAAFGSPNISVESVTLKHTGSDSSNACLFTDENSSGGRFEDIRVERSGGYGLYVSGSKSHIVKNLAGPCANTELRVASKKGLVDGNIVEGDISIEAATCVKGTNYEQ